MKYHFYIILIWTLTLIISCASNPSILKNRSIIPENFSTDAFLRTENGNHGSKITRIGVDANEKILVSVGEDKTIRVWDIENGRVGKNTELSQLRVIRPPIGGGKEGKLNAVAISPDASIIVAGGWTGKWQTEKPKLYIFDTQTGKMLQRLEIESQAYHLAFSDNGQYLVAAQQKSDSGVGFVLFKVEGNEFKKIGEGYDFEGDSYWAVFYKRGGIQYLAVSSLEGLIRIYSINENGLKGEKVLSAKSGLEAYSISVSSDGEELAVGYRDTPIVDVYSLQSYQFLFSPSSSGISSGTNVGKVAYSGNKLFAGGEYENSQGDVLLRIWQERGRGQYNDISIANQTVMHLLPGSQGNLWLATADPFIGKIQNDRISLRAVPQKGNFSEIQEGFGVSEDGTQISFSYNPKENTKYYFSLTGKRIEATGENFSLKNPSYGGIAKEKWFGIKDPTIYRKLQLQEGEVSRSLAFNADNTYYALGGDWNIYYNERLTGFTKLKISIPSLAWGVNITMDGKYIVAALGDGTIRWYKTENGEELIAFFPHPDKKRWVLWTPQGFYDCSVEGEEFIGWHVNSAKDKEADFFPIARFRETYFRPDILSKVLGKESVAVAVKEADNESGETTKGAEIEKSPSVKIAILSPRKKSRIEKEKTIFDVSVIARRKTKVTALKLTVDGAESETIDLENSWIEGEKKLSIPFLIQEGSYYYEISALDENGATIGNSDGVFIDKTVTNSNPKKPKLKILSIGINRYPDESGYPALKYAEKDADDFVKMMEKQKGLFYDSIEIVKITNQEATRERIEFEIEKLAKQNNSVTMVFFSGHGHSDFKGKFIFIPYDYKRNVLASGVRGEIILSDLSAIQNRVVLFLDACYSGLLTTGNLTKFLNTSSDPDKRNLTVFASSRDIQTSLESPEWGNGAFSKALKKGIQCGDAAVNGEITLKDLNVHLSYGVKQITKNKQNPDAVGFDYPLVIAKEKIPKDESCDK